MKKVLIPGFFNRPTLKVAEDLLGKFLVRRRRGKVRAYMITEVEAYDGFRDKASHTHRGMTARNAPMFGLAGHWYVYFTYGMHWMLNAVTGPKGYPAAVLIRGVAAPQEHGEPRFQIGREGISGPGKITKALGIGRGFINETASVKSGLWIEDRGVRVSRKNIKRTARVGVAYAGKYWAGRRYRFTIET